MHARDTGPKETCHVISITKHNLDCTNTSDRIRHLFLLCARTSKSQHVRCLRDFLCRCLRCLLSSVFAEGGEENAVEENRYLPDSSKLLDYSSNIGFPIALVAVSSRLMARTAGAEPFSYGREKVAS